MSVANQRTHLYNAVNGVASIGKGYNRYRYFNEWNEFLDLFKTTIGGKEQVRGFMLEYRGVPENINIQFNPAEHRRNVWFVHCFLGLSDADSTEVTFATLMETVITTIKDDATLQSGYFDVAPVITPIFEVRLFGDVLCHYAQVEVNITEFVA